MKKIALFAVACATILGSSNAVAQETTYVEDCTQGTVVEKMKNNWFITAQGGANVMFSGYDTHADFKNRIGADAAIYAGKWFTPVFGFRFGANVNMMRGATTYDGIFRDRHSNAVIDTKGGTNLYSERIATLGPEIDLMVNLTNWWCGYRPGRIYNAVLHGGAGGYWTFYHGTNKNGDSRWRSAHDRTLYVNLGLQNNFAVSKYVDLFLDLQATVMDYDNVENEKSSSKYHGDMTCMLSAQIGVTYNFGGSNNFKCPVQAVCPTWKYTDAEGDALVARLANADNQIQDLQRQLDDCLNRPTKDCPAAASSLATVYYPINVSTLSPREVTLVESMAKTMIANPDKKYILTGWADNYTGNEEINTRLRQERVDGVRNCLVNAGVPASQIETRIDANNLTDYGVKGAQFDRAVTVVEAK